MLSKICVILLAILLGGFVGVSVYTKSVSDVGYCFAVIAVFYLGVMSLPLIVHSNKIK